MKSVQGPEVGGQEQINSVRDPEKIKWREVLTGIQMKWPVITVVVQPTDQEGLTFPSA